MKAMNLKILIKRVSYPVLMTGAVLFLASCASPDGSSADKSADTSKTENAPPPAEPARGSY